MAVANTARLEIGLLAVCADVGWGAFGGHQLGHGAWGCTEGPLVP